MNSASPLVGVVMGSASDWETMKAAADILAEFAIPFEARVVSAHRMPDDMFAYAEGAVARGLQAIIAGAGGAAHLPGMLAAKTVVPVLGVPVASKHLQRRRFAAFHRPDAQGAFPWPPSRSAWPARRTRRCSRSRCSPCRDDVAARRSSTAFRAKQTEVARAMTQELR